MVGVTLLRHNFALTSPRLCQASLGFGGADWGSPPWALERPDLSRATSLRLSQNLIARYLVFRGKVEDIYIFGFAIKRGVKCTSAKTSARDMLLRPNNILVI